LSGRTPGRHIGGAQRRGRAPHRPVRMTTRGTWRRILVPEEKLRSRRSTMSSSDYASLVARAARLLHRREDARPRMAGGAGVRDRTMLDKSRDAMY
jgi:hypothetical protein